jgi:uncharacterized Zn finger protein (UPF0148 family)
MNRFLLKKIWRGLWASDKTRSEKAKLARVEKIQFTIVRLQQKQQEIQARMQEVQQGLNKDDRIDQLKLEYRAIQNLLERAKRQHDLNLLTGTTTD